MPSLNDLVVYHSSHFLRGKNPKLHAERLQHFLATCTTALQVLELSVQVLTGPGYDPSRGQSLINEFTERWGEPEITQLGGGSDGIHVAHCWPVDLDLDQALAAVTSLFSAGSQRIPMLSVSVRVQFQLLDPETGSAFAGQNWGAANYKEDFFFLPHGYSEIWADLGESSALGALISFRRLSAALSDVTLHGDQALALVDRSQRRLSTLPSQRRTGFRWRAGVEVASLQEGYGMKLSARHVWPLMDESMGDFPAVGSTAQKQ